MKQRSTVQRTGKNILFSRKYPARIFCKTYNEGGKSGEQGLGEGGRRDGGNGRADERVGKWVQRGV